MPSSAALTVTVLSGRDLPVCDVSGSSDPFCTLKVGGTKVKTEVVKQSLNPTWNQEFSFDITGDINTTTLLIDCWDEDLVTDDYMGKVTVPLSSIPKAGLEDWFPVELAETGQLLLRIHLTASEEHWKSGSATPSKVPSNQDENLINLIVYHSKPITQNVWCILYHVAVPLLSELIKARDVLMDWSNPASTLLFVVVFLIFWYHKQLIVLCLLYFTYRMAALFVAHKLNPDLRKQKPRYTPRQKYDIWKATKLDLLSTTEDTPLVSDLKELEIATTKIVNTLEDIHNNLVYWEDPAVFAKIWIVTGILILAFLFLPMGMILMQCMRYATLLLFLGVTVGAQIDQRFPGSKQLLIDTACNQIAIASQMINDKLKPGKDRDNVNKEGDDQVEQNESGGEEGGEQ